MSTATDTATTAQIELDRENGNFRYETDYAFDAGVGLTPATIDYIAGVKGEEPWVREFRHKALKTFDVHSIETELADEAHVPLPGAGPGAW